jgi:hypothetical protein
MCQTVLALLNYIQIDTRAKEEGNVFRIFLKVGFEALLMLVLLTVQY